MKNQIITVLLLIGCSISFIRCTKDFEEINTNPARIESIGEGEAPLLFSRAQAFTMFWFYQTCQNLNADLFAQYFALITPVFATDRYGMRYSWLIRHYRNAYVNVMPQLLSIIELTGEDSEQSALANLMWVYCFHRLTDEFGPIPYSAAGSAEQTIPYDPQEEIYDDFFLRIDRAIQTLKNSSESNVFGAYDLIYEGDIQKWIQFGNTLRLRLAMRISNVNPEKAKAEAEKSVQEGVMQEVEDEATLFRTETGSSNQNNPLAHISRWNEFRMSSTIYSYLKGYNDPKLSVYFQPAVETGEFGSVRNGMPTTMMDETQNSPNNTSNIGEYWVDLSETGQWIAHNTARQQVMSTAEAYFLRAEGALKGWDMQGDPQDLYEKGIEMSMLQWGITDQNVIESYIQSSLVPEAPGDFLNSPPVSDIPVQWADQTDNQFRQIATQKWLALYPDGLEAWADIRRSGYLDQYQIIEYDPNTKVPEGEFVKRLPYPTQEGIQNAEAVEEAISDYLNGPDNENTRLWWDVD